MRVVVVAIIGSGALITFLSHRSLSGQFDDALLARARDFSSLVIEEAEDPEEGEDAEVVFDYKWSLEERDIGAMVRVSVVGGETIAVSEGWPGAVDASSYASLDAEQHEISSVTLGDGRSMRLVTLVLPPIIEVPDHIAIPDHVEFAGPDEQRAPRVDPDDDDDDNNDDDNDTENDIDDDAFAFESEHLVAVQVLADTSPVRRGATGVGLAVLLSTLATCLVLAMTIRVLVDRGLEPLFALRQAIESTDPSRLRPIGHLPGERAEIEPIREAMNALLARLDGAIERERRFTDAAAHELRTPIAELRATSEVATRHPDERRQRESVAQSGQIAEEMTELIEALLLAARHETGETPEVEDVALSPIVRELVAHERGRASSKRLAVEVLADGDASWRVPRGTAVIVARNLIANAVAYTTEGGAVTVEVRRDGDATVLEVRNRPATMREADVERMFEPFWRADTARTDRAHRGLGLAIVRTQCEAFGLGLEAGVDDGEARVRVRGNVQQPRA